MLIVSCIVSTYFKWTLWFLRFVCFGRGSWADAYKEKGLFVKEASRYLDQSASDAEFAENEKARLQKQEREKELEQIYTRMHKARYERSVKDKMENELKEQEKLLREKLKKEEDMMKKKWREKTWIAKLFGSFR